MIQTPSVFASGAWGRNKGKTKLYVHGKIEGKLEGNIEDGAKDVSVDASHVA